MSNKAEDNSKSGARRQWIWIMLMVNIVFILLLITLGVIALRVGNALPEGTDVLFIVGKNPSYTAGDDVDGEYKPWSAEKNVEIFRSEYVNGEGITTVASSGGDKVFAPGTTTEYVFTMQNNGNMAVVYETDLDFTLKVGAEKVDGKTFPVKVRLKNANGDYLIGGEDSYEKVYSATLSRHPGLLGANSYENFTLELFWAYDGEDDDLDTALGNLSAETGVTLTLKINTYAEEAPDPSAQGGTKVEVGSTEEFGGTVRWLWLALLMINAAILVFYVAWLMNKRVNKF